MGRGDDDHPAAGQGPPAVRFGRAGEPTDLSDRPRAPYGIRDMTVEGGLVRLDLTYTGGCAAHHFELVATAWSVTEDGLRVELALTHDTGGDPCKALVRERLEFDLRPLLHELGDDLARAHGAVLLSLDDGLRTHPFTA